jgi:hypothetical protein
MGIATNHSAEAQKINNVEPEIAILELRDVRLGPSGLLGEFQLPNTRSKPLAFQRFSKPPMLIRVNFVSHRVVGTPGPPTDKFRLEYIPNSHIVFGCCATTKVQAHETMPAMRRRNSRCGNSLSLLPIETTTPRLH